MSTQILYGLNQTRNIANNIQSLDLDVVVSESHTLQNKITQFPVEEGSPITDHIRSQPDRLTMSCFITETPILQALQEFETLERLTSQAEQFSQLDSTKTLVSFLILEELAKGPLDDTGRRAPELLTVVSGLKVYTDMAIENVSIPRSQGTGASLRFTASFIKVRVVNSRTVELPNLAQDTTGAKSGTDKQGQSTVKRGKTSTKKEDTSKGLGFLEAITGTTFEE